MQNDFVGTSASSAVELSLNGEWRLDYFPQPDRGAVRTLPLPSGIDVRTVQATVPGNCELDLVRAGVLPNPEVGTNALALRPYEGFQWLYSKTFEAPVVAAGRRVELVFGGIDTLADVFLNGVKVGESENMFIERRFDVTDAIRPGANTVQVLIRSVFLEAQEKDVGELGHFLGGWDGEPFRKAAHMYGWDIFQRLIVSGLWRGVTVRVAPVCAVDNPAWIVSDVRRSDGHARIDIHCRVKGPMRLFDGRYTLRFRLMDGGRTVVEHRRPLHSVHHRCSVAADGLKLWWPRSFGEPFLYDGVIDVLAPDGAVCAENRAKIGIRTITLRRENWTSPEHPGDFLFIVNGEPCYIRGTNWVPLDQFHARDAEHLEAALEMVADLNCNMVRVWGGGVYESDAFFDWCDANGVMVWQDFMTGCSVFPQGDEFARLVEEETKSVVLRFRNHPSLALWSGNNENDAAFSWHTPPAFRRDPNDDRSSRETIPRVLMEFDVTRPYLPSSPYFDRDVAAGRAKPSEDHLWGERGYYKVPYYLDNTARFASEMGYHGCPCRASIERMMTPDCVYPWRDVATRDWNDEWRIKGTDCWMSSEIAPQLWNRNDLMLNQCRLMFGEVPEDLDTFIEASQLIQAEALKTFCELFRTRKFRRFNGLIWWNLRDGWPIVSDAVVDWFGARKKAYFALKNAQRDQLVCVIDNGEVWAVNDNLAPVGGHVHIADVASGTVLLDVDWALESNAAEKIGSVSWSGQGVLAIRYTVGSAEFRNWYLYGEPPFQLAETAAALAAAVTSDACDW